MDAGEAAFWHFFYPYWLKKTMKQKENKGGILSNEKLEQDLEVRRRNGATDTRGMQDTGDQKVRHMGNDVQKNDGLGKDENSGENRED